MHYSYLIVESKGMRLKVWHFFPFKEHFAEELKKRYLCKFLESRPYTREIAGFIQMQVFVSWNWGGRIECNSLTYGQSVWLKNVVVLVGAEDTVTVFVCSLKSFSKLNFGLTYHKVTQTIIIFARKIFLVQDSVVSKNFVGICYLRLFRENCLCKVSGFFLFFYLFFDGFISGYWEAIWVHFEHGNAS